MKLFSRLGLLPLALVSTLALFGCKPSSQEMEKAVGDYLQKNPQVVQKLVQDAMKTQRPPRPPEPPWKRRSRMRSKSISEPPRPKAPQELRSRSWNFLTFSALSAAAWFPR